LSEKRRFNLKWLSIKEAGLRDDETALVNLYIYLGGNIACSLKM
jgi:hypothetical protein